MPNGGYSPHSPAGVTVIGLGNAGCRMAAAVQNAVDRIDPDPVFNYITIDSSSDDLEQTAPPEAVKIALETPKASWEQNREAFGYLSETDDLAYSGAARQRTVGRYCVDNNLNFDAFYTRLSNALESASEQVNTEISADDQHIWALSSLGGGTGSGLVPLITVLLDEILPPEAFVFGLGSLPRLDALGMGARPPGGDTRTYLNAYAALRELRVLFGLDDTDPYPLTLQFESESEFMPSDGYVLDESPVDAYGLLGFHQDELTSSYRETMNQLAAELVVGVTSSNNLIQPLTGMWPNRVTETSLFSVDGSGVRAPIDEIRTYVGLNEEIADIESDIEQQDAKLELLTEARHTLDLLLDWSAESSLPESLAHLEQLLETVQEQVQTLDVTTVDEAYLETIIETVSSEFADREFIDTDVLASYFVTQELENRLAQERSSHAFPRKIEQLADKTPSEDIPQESTVPPEKRWERTLEPFLKQRRQTLKHRLDEASPLWIFRRKELDAELEQVTNRYRDLKTLYHEYNQIKQVQSQVSERCATARTQIQQADHTIKEQQEEIRNSREDLVNRRQGLRQERDSLENRITESQLGHNISLPVQNLDQLDADTLASIKSLSDLVEREIIEPEPLTRGLREMLNRLDEQVQDRFPYEVFANPDTDVALFVNDSDRSFIDGETEAVDTETSFSSSLEQFSSTSIIESGEQFRIRSVAQFTPIHLENTSEFGVIHDHYTVSERSIAELFGEEFTTDVVMDCFAYPELFLEEPNC